MIPRHEAAVVLDREPSVRRQMLERAVQFVVEAIPAKPELIRLDVRADIVAQAQARDSARRGDGKPRRPWVGGYGFTGTGAGTGTAGGCCPIRVHSSCTR